jgi:hypothetical protein
MGEVYRARDPKPGHELAIKVILTWFEEVKRRVPGAK